MKKESIFDIAVVGGGAAGMVSAIFAAESGKRVILLEQGSKLGRKILISGNGRCNLTNLDADITEHYHSSDRDFIQGILKKFNLKATLSFFSNLGIELSEEKRGRLFPRSNQAQSIVDVLSDRMQKLNIEIHLNFLVSELSKEGINFQIQTKDKKSYLAKNVILASGGTTVEKVGGNRTGLDLASRLGHEITTLKPGLVPLKSSLKYLKRMKGVKTVAIVRVRGLKGKEWIVDHDDLFIADYGVSGFTILNLSARVVPMFTKGPVDLLVNLFPNKNQNELYDALKLRWKRNPHRSLRVSFTGILNSKLIDVLLNEMGFDGQKIVSEIDDTECKRIAESLSNWCIPVSEPRGFDFAEVMIGGISTDEINPETLESYLCEGLFFCGEVIDVHGDLGGYNFQWAWSSGKVAGSNF